MTRERSAAIVRLVLTSLVFTAACAPTEPPSLARPTPQATAQAAPPAATTAPTPSVTPTAPTTPIATPTAATTPTATRTSVKPSARPSTTFAVIGDYGQDNAHETAVANLVSSWDPEYIISAGDGYYTGAGGNGTAKYDESTGAHFCDWLAGITTTGLRCPSGFAKVNAFFPAMGNHDYTDARPSPDTYLTYFNLPGKGLVSSSGNERYYDFVKGPIHFFVLNSNKQEPAGTSRTSSQAEWLETSLAASTSEWNIVVDHHPPYSSGDDHGSATWMRWPFAQWGADAVISGHSHTYERVMRDGIVYFVNGLGGSPRDGFTTPVAGTASYYNDNWGAQRVTVTPTSLQFEFHDVTSTLIDSHTIRAP